VTWLDRLPDSIKVDPSGCHIWTKALNSRGYGNTWFQDRMHLAHRVAWFHAHGRWPTDGLVLDHICNTRACVNPAHLRELTNGANIMRAIPRGTAQVEARRAEWRARQRLSRARRAAS
jgi:hypothetical protein